MKIFGHNFLRSNFTKGSPLRLTAGHRQTNRVANVLKNIEGIGCRIVKSTESDGKDWYVIVDGGSDLPYPDGVSPLWESIADQFEVYEVASDTLKVRGGVWQYAYREWDSGDSENHEKKAENAPSDSATITWAGDSNHQGANSNPYTVTQDCDVWLKLDRSSVADVLTVEVLTSDPTVDYEIYWLHLASVSFANGAITEIDVIHTGSVDMYLDTRTGATTTTIIPTGTAADTGTWRSNDGKELQVLRWRTYLDASNYIVKVYKHTEHYGSNGRLLLVEAETLVDTLDLDPVDVTVATDDMQYDTSTHTIQIKTRSIKVLSAGSTSGWTSKVTFYPCP